jgi:hypothetical protein
MSFKNRTTQTIADQDIDQRSAFENTFEDALTLLQDTRDFLAETPLPWRSKSQVSEQLQDAVLLSKVTSRLISIMAWMVVQKKAIAAAIEGDQAPRLSVCDDDLANFPTRDETNSERLNDLIDRTVSMFARIVRLSALVDAINTGAPQQRPSEFPAVAGVHDAVSDAHATRE